MKKFCGHCGKELRRFAGYYLHPDFDTNSRFDRGTGKESKPSYAKIETFVCPTYEEGYSDRWWSVGDRVDVVSKVTKTEWKKNKGRDGYHLRHQPTSILTGVY